jgi:hypothetical protein
MRNLIATVFLAIFLVAPGSIALAADVVETLQQITTS